MGVPSIFATEPVYLSETEARWVTCELEWDPQHEQFINKEAQDDWILVDGAMCEATYTVDDTEYGDLDTAIQAAMNRGVTATLTRPEDVTVCIEPHDERSPRYGPRIF